MSLFVFFYKQSYYYLLLFIILICNLNCNIKKWKVINVSYSMYPVGDRVLFEMILERVESNILLILAEIKSNIIAIKIQNILYILSQSKATL